MTSELHSVRLLALPVPLWQQSQEHSDELIREFMLIASDEGAKAHDVPARLLALVEQLTANYGAISEENEQRLAGAAAAGEDSIDLVYEVPRELEGAVAHLGQMLDEADVFCRHGKHLLTLATPEPQVEFRRWFLDEFTRQLSGESPTPWPVWSAERRPS